MLLLVLYWLCWACRAREETGKSNVLKFRHMLRFWILKPSLHFTAGQEMRVLLRL